MESEDQKENRRWERTSIYLGSVEDGTSSKVEFKTIGEIPEVKLLRSSCGCTSVKILGNILTASISHTKAKHLGEQKFQRNIEVHYKNGSMDKFLITGKIV